MQNYLINVNLESNPLILTSLEFLEQKNYAYGILCD
jgi:hypothetical protein